MLNNEPTLADIVAGAQTLRCPFNSFVDCYKEMCAMRDSKAEACMRDRHLCPLSYCAANPWECYNSSEEKEEG